VCTSALFTGDFDEYDLFGQRVSYVTVGKWLARVLHCPNNLKGDSPKVHGATGREGRKRGN
jgi:hypothetical protein